MESSGETVWLNFPRVSAFVKKRDRMEVCTGEKERERVRESLWRRSFKIMYTTRGEGLRGGRDKGGMFITLL